MNLKIKRLISDCITDLIDNNISVELVHEKFIDVDCGKGSGYYNCSVLKCATKWPLEYWIDVFTHEYCHFRQEKDKYEGFVTNSCESRFDRYVTKKDYNPPSILNTIRKIQTMELDCEIRSTDLMKRYELDFNFPRIIQRKNAYVYGYTAMHKMKKWYKTPPSSIKEIVNLMPDVFLKPEQYYTIPDYLHRMYKEHCLKLNQDNEKFDV